MKIPKTVQLFGVTVNVSVIPPSEWRHEDECVGIYYEQRNEIHILERSEDSTAQTYMHELVHAVFTMLGYEELSNNEQMIDSVASLLHQALSSARD